MARAETQRRGEKQKNSAPQRLRASKILLLNKRLISRGDAERNKKELCGPAPLREKW